MGFGLVMYIDFSGNNPRFFKSIAEGDIAGGISEQLTFRFDSSGWLFLYHFGVAVWLKEHLLPDDLTPEACATEKFPKALAFSGASGGSLVAAALATGIDLRELFEYVLSHYPTCRRNPRRLMSAAEGAMSRYLPKNAAQSMSGRVRVLLTRISTKPPFLTGEVVNQFTDYNDVFHRLRASCHVPALNPCPYRHKKRLYYDGLLWSSLLVPWAGQDVDLVVKVSALASLLSDIRARLHPLWWALFPPSVDVLRGLFWVGYRDAANWFLEPSSGPLDMCKCRSEGRKRFRFDRPNGDKPDDVLVTEETDTLSSSRFAKHNFAQKFLIKKPNPEAVLPETDPVSGQAVAYLIGCYDRAVNWNIQIIVLVCITILIAVTSVVALKF